MIGELKIIKLFQLFQFFVLADFHAIKLQLNNVSIIVEVLKHQAAWLRLNVIGIKRVIGCVIRVIKLSWAAFPLITCIWYALRASIIDITIVEGPVRWSIAGVRITRAWAIASLLLFLMLFASSLLLVFLLALFVFFAFLVAFARFTCSSNALRCYAFFFRNLATRFAALLFIFLFFLIIVGLG